MFRVICFVTAFSLFSIPVWADKDEDPLTISGTIETVAAKQVTLRDDIGESRMVPLAETCTIMVDGEQATLLDLKPGMSAKLNIGPDAKCINIDAKSPKP